VDVTLLRSTWLRPLNDLDAIDDWLGLLNPAWSIGRIRARIATIDQETPDTCTFRLIPNWRWPGFEAGQHVVVEVELDGVRHHRTFSLSSAPWEATLALTVKRQGRVTRAMHERLRAGDVLTLSPPAGTFVLPQHLPGQLVFVAAGTGITPMRSMLWDLAGRDYKGAITLVHVCRDPRQQLFAWELVALAQRLPGLRLHVHDTSTDGRPSADELVRSFPALASADTFLCGPPAFMDELRTHPALAGLGARLRMEHFGAPLSSRPGEGLICAARSGVSFAASGGPILIDAEAAGLAPKHGCRVGVCQTCKVRKLSGSVEDLRTGRISDRPDELISICVSAARGELVLDL
jgi:ferredoxin-NADP reductase